MDRQETGLDWTMRDVLVLQSILALPAEARCRLLMFFHWVRSPGAVMAEATIARDGSVEVRLSGPAHEAEEGPGMDPAAVSDALQVCAGPG